MRGLNTHSGIVLAEALVAVVIVSVGVVVIMQALVANLRASMVQQDYAKALLLLQDKLEERFFQDAVQASKREEPAPKPLDRFRYQWEYKNVLQDRWVGLKQLDIAVSWASGKNGRELNFKAFLPDMHTQETTTSVFYK